MIQRTVLRSERVWAETGSFQLPPAEGVHRSVRPSCGEARIDKANRWLARKHDKASNKAIYRNLWWKYEKKPTPPFLFVCVRSVCVCFLSPLFTFQTNSCIGGRFRPRRRPPGPAVVVTCVVPSSRRHVFEMNGTYALLRYGGILENDSTASLGFGYVLSGTRWVGYCGGGVSSSR